MSKTKRFLAIMLLAAATTLGATTAYADGPTEIPGKTGPTEIPGHTGPTEIPGYIGPTEIPGLTGIIIGVLNSLM